MQTLKPFFTILPLKINDSIVDVTVTYLGHNIISPL